MYISIRRIKHFDAMGAKNGECFLEFGGGHGVETGGAVDDLGGCFGGHLFFSSGMFDFVLGAECVVMRKGGCWFDIFFFYLFDGFILIIYFLLGFSSSSSLYLVGELKGEDSEIDGEPTIYIYICLFSELYKGANT